MFARAGGPTKSYDLTIPFTQNRRTRLWYPIMVVSLQLSTGGWQPFRLIFDTGASTIVLRREFADQFPPAALQDVGTVGSGKARRMLVTRSQADVLGRIIPCQIVLAKLPANYVVDGLLGRECLEPFVFGYSQTAQEIYVRLSPS
jgi:hypothetical protein